MPRKKTQTPSAGKSDWMRINALSDDDIEIMAAQDQDNPATEMDDWANAQAVLPPRKTVINARFDTDVVAWFKSLGPGYQPRMNAVLRRYMDAQTKHQKS